MLVGRRHDSRYIIIIIFVVSVLIWVETYKDYEYFRYNKEV